MSMFYTARHAAPKTSSPVTKRAGAGVLAATALGLGASTMTATSAAAQAPDVPAQSTPATSGGAQSAPVASESTSTESTDSTDSAEETTFSGVVEKGDSGETVEEIQDEVGVSTDGNFGSETESAVKDFQDDEGLAVDGVVGPETGSKLGLSGSASTGSSSSSSDDDSSSSSSSSSESTDSSSASVSSSSSSGAQSVSSSSTSSSGIVGTAESLIGSPYVYGGTSPSGFDCSGFVQYVYGKNGKDVPRTTQQQMAAATPVSDPQPGDIVFFGDDAYHNGIYVGDGKIIDAGNSDSPVQERDIWTDDVTYGRF